MLSQHPGSLMKITLLASAIALALAAPASAAITIGDTLKIDYIFPFLGNVIQSTNSFVYTGAGQTVGIASTTNLILSDNSVTFANNFGLVGASFASVPYDGSVLTNLSNPSAFAGWTVTSSSHPYTAAFLSGSAIGVNFSGKAYIDGGAVTISGGVPEASAWTMLIAGFGMIGFTARRRRAAVAA